MGDEPNGTLGERKNAITPDPGKTVTVEQFSELSKSVESLTKLVGGLAPALEAVSKTVNGIAAEKRRSESKTEDEEKGKKKPDPEVLTLQEKVTKLTEENAKNRKRIALKEALDSYGDSIVGRNHIEKLIAGDLDFNSNDEVVAVVDGKHVPLKDHVKSYAEDPQFKAPTGKNGTGKPDATAKTKVQPERTIPSTDQAAINANWREIREGKVKVVEG